MKQRKVKILFVLTGLAPGGTERQLCRQLHVFDHNTFEVLILPLFRYSETESIAPSLPSTVKVIDVNPGPRVGFEQFKKIIQLLKTEQPDLVVPSAYAAGALFRVLKPFFGYRVVTREHNLHVEKNFFQRFIGWLLAPLADEMVAISSTVADFSSRQTHVKRSRYTVILNGIPLEEIKAYQQAFTTNPKAANSARKKFGLPQDKKIVLNVGRLKYQKNQALLIDGFEKFKAKFDVNNEYVLCIAGAGSEAEALNQKIKQLGVEADVYLLGYTPQIYDLYCLADIFAFTSRYEGGPNAVLEALAFSLPVITTKVAGMDEYIIDGQNGFFIESTPEDVCRVLGHVHNMVPNELEWVKKKLAQQLKSMTSKK